MAHRSLTMALALVAVCLMVASAEAKAKEKALRGKIVSISSSKLTINVKTDKTDKTGTDKEFDVSPNVSVTVDGQPGKIDDIKVGDAVTYRLDNDGKVVTDINKGKKPKKTT